jgi:hypothetical protein
MLPGIIFTFCSQHVAYTRDREESHGLARNGVSLLSGGGWEAVTQPSVVRHLLSPAVQFSTTVIGLGAGSPVWVLIRKRRPSLEGT